MLSATGGATSSDPFEVSKLPWQLLVCRMKLDMLRIGVLCMLCRQGMSPEEINEYVQQHGQVAAM